MLYGNGLVDSLPQPEDNENYQVSSQRFPFTINVNGPGATALAWHYLPTQLPLAVLLSLLVGYIAWLATAYRMKLFPANSIWAWRNMSRIVLSAFA